MRRLLWLAQEVAGGDLKGHSHSRTLSASVKAVASTLWEVKSFEPGDPQNLSYGLRSCFCLPCEEETCQGLSWRQRGQAGGHCSNARQERMAAYARQAVKKKEVKNITDFHLHNW